MVRYPHILQVAWRTETTFNATGMPIAGTGAATAITGRAEANGRGNLVRLDDGAQIVYDWSFFCRPVSEVPYGADATLYEGTAVIWEGTIKRHARGQKHSQIWL